jgi:hypothetical protein
MSDVLKDEAEVAGHYAWFARMWVLAGLFHLFNQISWPAKPFEPTPARVVNELLMLAVAGWVFRAPRQAAPFLTFLVLEFAHGLRDIPRVANHWYITFLMVSAMLASALATWNTGPRFSVVAWFRAFAPGARWLLAGTAGCLVGAGLLLWLREGERLFTDGLIAAIARCF